MNINSVYTYSLCIRDEERSRRIDAQSESEETGSSENAV